MKLFRDFAQECGESSHFREGFDQAWQTLTRGNVLEEVKVSGEWRYRLKEGKTFFLLNSCKTVSISRKGDRSLRIMVEALALRNMVSEKVVGSIVWKTKMHSPKYRLERVSVTNPLTDYSRPGEFEVLQDTKNDLAFKLKFKPSLSGGEFVKYRFYTWTQNHYAMSRQEALDLNHDEWIREGLAVSDPTERLTIKVRLPRRYSCQKIRIEKNPTLRPDGPNVSGSILSNSEGVNLIRHGETLQLTMNTPEEGRYFVCWIPPE
jgi:hypothetical protein